MTDKPISASGRDLIASAAAALKAKIDEVNRLNVFPVPDGDTGTNMSLTMDTVVAESARLVDGDDVVGLCHAVTHGSLMGARGNSGVILSQILRGACEGASGADAFNTDAVAAVLEQASAVAYQAVRKPVEGTMLTVIKDTASAARAAADAGYELSRTLESIRAASYESVRRTPELLDVLKENGVVDAGGYGLAILVDGFVAAALGGELAIVDIQTSIGDMHVEPADDWDDDEYLYCTEFLLFGDGIDREAVHDYVASVGGSELVVGDGDSYKVHVHTDDPGSVLAHMTGIGEVAEVHVNNMKRQKQERDEMLGASASLGERKPVGFVAVAAGGGLVQILKSLGVDVVVSGGQTMNPSTADLAEAARSVHAEKVVILPNNKNIQMAATAAISLVDRPVAVVPTRSVPQGFAALLAFDGEAEFDEAVEAMTEAASLVRTGEITAAVKDAKGRVGPIKAGQIIGIVDDEEIDAVGASVAEVARALSDVLAPGAENLTLIAGEELDDDALAAIETDIAQAHPELEIECHRGDQPLYPLIMSAE